MPGGRPRRRLVAQRPANRGQTPIGGSSRSEPLLAVVLDRVGAARLGVVGIEAELALGPPLPQQVPAAVERDADLVEPGPVTGPPPPVTLPLVQRLLPG